MKNFKGFTLAEVLMTLGIIGVIATIISGVVGNIMPDRNVVMFKKAYTDLAQITDKLISDSNYYGGDEEYPDSGFGPSDLRYIDGYSSMSQKFCTLAETYVETKISNCASNTFTGTDGVVWTFSDDSSNITCKFDVNGLKDGGEFSVNIHYDGTFTPDDNAKTIIEDPLKTSR